MQETSFCYFCLLLSQRTSTPSSSSEVMNYGMGVVPQTCCCCRCSHQCHFWSSREFWNVHQEPEQMFCKINLSTYQQDINTYQNLVSPNGLRMKTQHHSNTLQWKMHNLVKWCWYQESAGDLVQLFWILSRGSQVWACKATGFTPHFRGGWTNKTAPQISSWYTPWGP